MEQDRTLRTLRALMLGINLALVLYYSLLRGLTTLRLARGFAARDFLALASLVPAPPWQMTLLSLGLFVPLAALILAKGRLAPQRP